MAATEASTDVKLPGVAAPAYVPAVLRNRRWLWPAGFVLAGLVLFGAYLRQAATVPVQSDGASNALQAWDMLHGNLLLHGWTLTDISFYTIDLPVYMLTEAARGLGSGAADIASALTYTLVVILAALLAKGRADGREGVVRALLAAGIMFAPPLGSTTATLLNDPDHTGTQIPLLLVWLILDRARPRWRAPLAVTVLLAWAQIADPIVLYEGILPLVLVCGVKLYQRRDRLVSNLPESWYELSLAGGAIVATGMAAVGMRLIARAGGFAISPPDTMFSSVGALASHLSVTAESILVVFGADFSGKQLGIGAAIPLIHLAGVALACWATARAMRRFASAELVVQLLVVALVILLAAYTFSGGPNVIGGPHEIVGILPIGAVLAGRLLAAPLISGRHLTVLAALLACSGLILAHDVVQPPGYDAQAQLATWLEAHHLKYGLATYWNASSVTVDSGGKVTVRPVNRNARGNVDAVQRDTVGSWYDPHLHDATFLVLPRPHVSCVAGTPHQWLTAVTAEFGPPAESYRTAGFTVLVWDKNLLTQVAPPIVGAC